VCCVCIVHSFSGGHITREIQHKIDRKIQEIQQKAKTRKGKSIQQRDTVNKEKINEYKVKEIRKKRCKIDRYRKRRLR